ncbi:phosphatidate cytidylyltransferase [Blastopirellula sp. JC732]|uniref:Phosphatidate cytidylyltransferase n=1 Tax=Blastopirellula sediminis TaxID=2894196 RepID=A0A9X1MRV1_9BACT|nr:phosphatidate cytidylyltransferase [Blastopirellula sediminis]MCC9605410.1 phosphatidate cytidylyltransferase [Blastopirellula sediminis]MCC9631290.1 phosphatidate cytidylyltransferase [Blastopirellula sediminis]
MTLLSQIFTLFAQSPSGHLLDGPTGVLLGVVIGCLLIATAAGQVLKRQPDSSVNPAIVQAFIHRVRAWWLMTAILAVTFLIPTPVATVILFGLISFWALREFITLTPTRLGDHRTLFWVFFVLTPAQYVLVGLGSAYYELFAILIPVYGFLFVSARIAIAGDYKRFLERVAKIQVGLYICVYALSYAPALLYLEKWTNSDYSTSAGLLFFFILIAQLSDLLQFVCGKFIGRNVIAPSINASRTWEGFFAGTGCTAIIGAALSLTGATPFNSWQSALMSIVIAVMGAAGTMTMSAIKRDRGVRDYGTLVEGHAGVLDRIDAICFAAPVFYHITRYYFTTLAG